MNVNQFVTSVMDQLKPFLAEGQTVEFDIPVSGSFEKQEDKRMTAVVGGPGRISFKAENSGRYTPLSNFLWELDDDLPAHVLNTDRRINVRARVVTDKNGRIWVTREGAELSFEKFVHIPKRQVSS